MGETARWLDREAAAAYLSLRVDELPRKVKEGKLPQPSYHFGPKSPRWDRHKLDEMLGGPVGFARRPDIDARIAAIASEAPRRRKASS